jgi:S-adenosylmethionine/arginine decarboxylase-like enzyme
MIYEEEGMISKVKRGFATHFMADLYMCQKPLWERPDELLSAIGELANHSNITGFQWLFHSLAPEWLRITGEIVDSFVWIQVFPEESFLTLDIFSWQPQAALKSFSEALLEVFEPQVVAVESKIRGEHLGG